MTIEQAVEGSEPLDATVAARARGLMGERRLRQQDLARALGLSRSAMSMRLTGGKEFALSEVSGLAGALGTTEAYLLGFTDDRGVVRHVGLEPTTRWLTLCPPVEADDEPLADVVPFPVHLASVPVSA